MKKFHEDYSRRIRTYIVNEYSDQAFLSQLPKEQFSIVAAQTFLNFKPLEIINKIITEVFDLLKPGGAFVFTYNNCDFYGAVELAERSFACYTPGRLIKEHASKIGYNISFDYTEPNVTSFLELTKPGSRTSIRGGQTLALIKNNTIELEPIHFVKSDSDKKQKAPKVIDSVDTNYYNDEYIQKIQLSALIIGIDTKRNLVNYSIEKLEQLITERLNKRDFDHKKFQKRLDKLINKRKTP
jgi:SAM-dependent methyltransferase